MLDELFEDDWVDYEPKYIYPNDYEKDSYNVVFVNGDEAVINQGKVLYYGQPENSTHDTTGDEIRKAIQDGKLIKLEDLSAENQAAIQRIIDL